ncbi:hypothetical protein ACLOJK_003423 [Asimina triloba]
MVKIGSGGFLQMNDARFEYVMPALSACDVVFGSWMLKKMTAMDVSDEFFSLVSGASSPTKLVLEKMSFYPPAMTTMAACYWRIGKRRDAEHGGSEQYVDMAALPKMKRKNRGGDGCQNLMARLAKSMWRRVVIQMVVVDLPIDDPRARLRCMQPNLVVCGVAGGGSLRQLGKEDNPVGRWRRGRCRWSSPDLKLWQRRRSFGWIRSSEQMIAGSRRTTSMAAVPGGDDGAP